MNIYSKNIDNITQQDIQSLVDDEIPEGERLEFKEKNVLNSDTNKSWDDHRKLSQTTKAKIIKEIVAFANTRGGVLILGIAEKEGSADELTLIPDCMELKKRLLNVIREQIEPELSYFQIREVVYNENGEGVIVIRAPQSRNAPHRSKLDKEAYKRNGSNSDPMHMREIQDLTLFLDRGHVRIEKLFNEKREDFHQRLKGLKSTSEWVAIRVTAVPLDASLYIDNALSMLSKSFPLYRYCYSVINHDDKIPRNLEFPAWDFRDIKPVLRGAIKWYEDKGGYTYICQKISCEGVVDFWLIQTLPRDQLLLCLDWIFVNMCNVLDQLEMIKQASGSVNVEYGLEMEQRFSDEEIKIRSLCTKRNTHSHYKITDMEVTFPRLAYNSFSDFDKLLTLQYKDILNWLGQDFGELSLHFEKCAQQ